MAGASVVDVHARGILETSPGALAVIVVFFLVVTLGFEKGLHHVRHSLRHRKKFGLLAAVDNLSSELMLLSVATLFMSALAPAVTKICLPPGNVYKPWLSQVKGCSCCLAKTKGVTPCFVQDYQCPADFKQQCNPEGAYTSAILKRSTAKEFPDLYNSSFTNKTTNYAKAAADNTTRAATTAGYGKRRLAAAAAAPDAAKSADRAVCSGAFLESYAECGNRPGWVPEVTNETLHQVHLLLFVMAVVHIVISAVVVLLSTLKLRLWNLIGGGPAEDHLAAAALAAASSSTQQQHPPVTRGGKSVDLVTTNPAAAAAKAAADWRHANRHAAGATGGLQRQRSGEAVLVVDAGPAAAADLVVPNWRGRPLTLQGPLSYLQQCAVLVLRQLLLLHPTLTRQEYAVLRASFYLTHLRQEDLVGGKPTAKAHSSHNTGAAPVSGGLYAPYLLECCERDGSKTVGLGLPMWIAVLVFVLLSGAIGYTTWLFLILAGGLLLVINTSLLVTARRMTRGGIVKAQQPGSSRWLLLHNPRLLLGCIKLILFCLAFVISQSVYFAAFFGTESCFFSNTGFQRSPMPWWCIMIIDFGLLLSLALFTLPLYTITSHTLRADRKLLQQIVRQRQQQQQQQQHQEGAGHLNPADDSDDEWEDAH